MTCTKAHLAADKNVDWLTIRNQAESVLSDVRRIRAHPLVPASVPVYGYIYDVKNGRLVEVPEASCGPGRLTKKSVRVGCVPPNIGRSVMNRFRTLVVTALVAGLTIVMASLATTHSTSADAIPAVMSEARVAECRRLIRMPSDP